MKTSSLLVPGEGLPSSQGTALILVLGGISAYPEFSVGLCGRRGWGYNWPPRMALSSGTKLGPYEIQSPLGAGGMGEVYRARDTRLDRMVAIKVLPSHLSSDIDFQQRF